MMPADSPHHGRTDNGTGHQIPVPRKFPQGLRPVVDHINSLGMRMGIYTGFSSATCGHGEGSPGFELTDGKWYAEQGIG
jgi:alpha-galactosidase|eukprot:COSAG01_NODE_20806_length_934_cov_1.171257_1_plen_79_part_00